MSASIDLVNLLRTNTNSACIGFLLQGAMLVLAYLAMLVVMTYSIELFSSVILGLLLGPLLAKQLSRRRARGALASSLSNTEPSEESGIADAEEAGYAGAGTPCCRMAMGQAHQEEVTLATRRAVDPELACRALAQHPEDTQDE